MKAITKVVASQGCCSTSSLTVAQCCSKSSKIVAGCHD